MNRVSLTGKLIDDPKSRTLEFRGASTNIVSLWLEVHTGERSDRAQICGERSDEGRLQFSLGVGARAMPLRRSPTLA